MSDTQGRPGQSGETVVADGPGGPEYGRRGHTYLVVSTWTGTLLLLVATWAVALMLSGRDAEEALQRAHRDTANLARVVAEQAVRTIAGADQILTFLSYDLSRLGNTDPRLHDIMSHTVQGSPVLMQLSFSDAGGKLIQTSVDTPPANVSLADREHFTVHKEGRVQGLFISRPVFGRASGRWSLQLSRRIDGPGGAFGGIVVASLDPFYFSHTLSDLDVGRQGAVSIVGRDGILRARTVMDEKIIGQDVSGTQLFKTALEKGEGFLRSTSGIDGVTRLWGFRSVPGYPLMVMAGFSEAEFMADVFQRRQAYLAVAIASTLVLLTMALAVTWQARGQQRARAAADESARRLRDIAETASDWFWETDEGLRFIGFSGSFRHPSGDGSPVIGRTIGEIAAREFGDEEEWGRLRKALRSRVPFRHFECAVPGVGGDLRIWSLNGKPVFRAGGIFGGYRGSGSDITERRRAERSLAASERRYRAMFAAVGQPIVVTDPVGQIVGFNPSAEGLFGLREADLLGRNVTCLMPEDQAWIHPGHIVAYQASGRARPVSGLRELMAKRADGTLLPIEIDLSNWHSDEGDFFIGIIRDISVPKQIEAELRRARDAAEQASRMKSAFLATISHELRTPMNGVLITLDLLRRETVEAGECRRLAAIAHRSAEGLLELLDDILDFSRLEAGQTTAEERRCIPAAVVDTVIGAFGPQAEKKGLVLSARMLPGMPGAVITDPARLRQILFNLVGNAIKFTVSGHVAVRGRRGADIGDRRFLLEFEIEDTGIGIPPDVFPTLFDRFTQADSSTARKYGGAGLGLAICKELCRLLDGDITVESEPGRGSVFRFTIACRAAEADEETAAPGAGIPAAGSAPSLRPLRILAVDDNDINRETARALLERGGHSVVTAGGGQEAAHLANQTVFDVVLMDVQMPEMDGLAATRAIHALPPPNGLVPVIGWTANTSETARFDCLAAGMSGFVTKPLRPAVLMAEISAVLAARPSAAFAEAEPAAADRHAEDGSPLLETELVAMLAEAMGPEEWPAFVTNFEHSARTQIAALGEALVSGAEYAKLAHTLKGMAWSVGARRLGNAALGIEQGAETELRSNAARLDDMLVETVTALLLVH